MRPSSSLGVTLSGAVEHIHPASRKVILHHCTAFVIVLRKMIQREEE
jgi:hypothetical protein